MDSLAEILESDLSDAVQVTNPRSLHRYITLLTQNLVQRENNDREHSEFRETIIRIDTRIEEGFKRMDERFESLQRTMDARFEAVDKRFELMQRNMEARFEAVDKRFTMLFSFMSLGFVLLATLMSVYQFLS